MPPAPPDSYRSWYSKPDEPFILLGSIDLEIINPLREYMVANITNEWIRHQPSWWEGVHSYAFPMFSLLHQDRLCDLQGRSKKLAIINGLSQKIYKRVIELNPGNSIYNCELNVMVPGTEIRPHIDGSAPSLVGTNWWHEVTKRVHVPIYTNPYAFLICGGAELNMPTGTVYEFQNRLLHSGKNPGPTPRIHWVFDLIPDQFCKEFEDWCLKTPGAGHILKHMG